MNDRQTLFDRWAGGYDDSVHDADFPFLGYEQVLDTIVKLAHTQQGTAVLDLGIGTGSLTERLLAMTLVQRSPNRPAAGLWGVDFSSEMLARAHARLPDVNLVQVDLLAPVWPAEVTRRFDRIVSAYVFHEFSLQTKLDLLERLADSHLAPEGNIVIGDIAFPTAELRAAAHGRWAASWDEEETYWAADEILPVVGQLGLQATYTQVSACAGVFAFSRP